MGWSVDSKCFNDTFGVSFKIIILEHCKFDSLEDNLGFSLSRIGQISGTDIIHNK